MKGLLCRFPQIKAKSIQTPFFAKKLDIGKPFLHFPCIRPYHSNPQLKFDKEHGKSAPNLKFNPENSEPGKNSEPSKNSETGSKNPENGSKNAENGSKHSENGSKNAENRSKNAENGSKNAETGSKHSENGSKHSESASQNFKTSNHSEDFKNSPKPNENQPPKPPTKDIPIPRETTFKFLLSHIYHSFDLLRRLYERYYNFFPKWMRILVYIFLLILLAKFLFRLLGNLFQIYLDYRQRKKKVEPWPNRPDPVLLKEMKFIGRELVLRNLFKSQYFKSKFGEFYQVDEKSVEVKALPRLFVYEDGPSHIKAVLYTCTFFCEAGPVEISIQFMTKCVPSYSQSGAMYDLLVYFSNIILERNEEITTPNLKEIWGPDRRDYFFLSSLYFNASYGHEYEAWEEQLEEQFLTEEDLPDAFVVPPAPKLPQTVDQMLKMS